MLEVINNRRSIRKYSNKELPKEDIVQILAAGVKAPSAKNRQPWKFVVVQGEAKKNMLEVFQKGLERERDGTGLLPSSKQHLDSAAYTVKILQQAPVVIFILNSEGKDLFQDLTFEEKVYEAVNLQSISAAIQNMILAATEMGIGSLWIGDLFFAYSELKEWLNTKGELIAALALGYPAESPQARPRKELFDILEWRE